MSPTSPARGGRRRSPTDPSLAPADPRQLLILSRSRRPADDPSRSGAAVDRFRERPVAGNESNGVPREPGTHRGELVGALARAGNRDRFHVGLVHPRERAPTNASLRSSGASTSSRPAPTSQASCVTAATPQPGPGAGHGPRRPPRTAPPPRVVPSSPRALRGARPGPRGRRGDPGRALRSARGRSRPSQGAGQRPMSARAHGAKRVRALMALVQRRSGTISSSASLASRAAPSPRTARGTRTRPRPRPLTTFSRGNASAGSSFR